MVIRFIRTLGHVVHALLDDAQALPHLLDPHHRAIVAIAAFGRWNVELKLVVSGVRLPLAKIPIESAGAKVGARHAPLDCFIHGEAADAFGARLENPVSHHRAVVLDQARRQVLDEIAEQFLPAFG